MTDFPEDYNEMTFVIKLSGWSDEKVREQIIEEIGRADLHDEMIITKEDIHMSMTFGNLKGTDPASNVQKYIKELESIMFKREIKGIRIELI